MGLSILDTRRLIELKKMQQQNLQSKINQLISQIESLKQTVSDLDQQIATNDFEHKEFTSQFYARIARETFKYQDIGMLESGIENFRNEKKSLIEQKQKVVDQITEANELIKQHKEDLRKLLIKEEKLCYLLNQSNSAK